MNSSFLLTLQNKLNPDNYFKAFVILLVLGVLAYANAIFHPFVHDDVVFIEKNPAITSWNIKDIFFRTASTPQNSSLINQYYRPLLDVVYRLEYSWFKLNAHQYHLVNILIHILNSFFLFKIWDFFQPSRRILSLVFAAVFLLHPVQTEAVACVAGISNLLFVFFGLLSFWFYLRSGSPGEKLALYFSLVSFVLALFSKEQAVILPFLFMLYEFCFATQEKKSSYKKIVLFFCLLGAYFLLRKIVLGAALTGIFSSDQMVEFWLRIQSIPATLLMYLGLIFFPGDLHYYRSVDILNPSIVALLILFLVFGLLVFFISKVGVPRRKFVVFGFGWFFITLAPMLNILPLINEYSLILTAEHFLYLPLAGFILAAGSLVDSWAVKVRLTSKILGVVALGIVLTSVTIFQNRFWKSEVALFERMTRFEPQFGRGNILLAKAYYADGQYQKALLYYSKAFEIMKGYRNKVQNPEVKKFYEGFIKEIYFDAAHCYEALSQFTKAAEHYALALKLDPHDSAIHNNIGINYMYLQQFSQAIAHFEEAIKDDSQNLQAMNNMAVCLIQQGEVVRAKQLWEDILKIDSMFLPAIDNLEGLRFQAVQE